MRRPTWRAPQCVHFIRRWILSEISINTRTRRPLSLSSHCGKCFPEKKALRIASRKLPRQPEYRECYGACATANRFDAQRVLPLISRGWSIFGSLGIFRRILVTEFQIFQICDGRTYHPGFGAVCCARVDRRKIWKNVFNSS